MPLLCLLRAHHNKCGNRRYLTIEETAEEGSLTGKEGIIIAGKIFRSKDN